MSDDMGNPLPSEDVDAAQQRELDENRRVDAAQQAALDENAKVDAKQQNQIDSLVESRLLMFVMLVIGAVGSLFQIWESITVWLRLK